MNPLSKYDIPFVGLKMGSHHFFYTIEESFFELFENDNFQKPAINIDLEFEKGNLFHLTFHVGGTFHTDCDRCSEEFELELNDLHHILVKYNDGILEQPNEEADILFIERNDTHINVAKLIYDFILLSIPMQKMHPDDAEGNPGCEIKYTEPVNTEEENKPDPRWDALKGIDFG